ncbi:MAG: response regulator transcription factor [Bdellovibrionota bacterium]
MPPRKLLKKAMIVDDYEDFCQLMVDVLSSHYKCSFTSESSRAIAMIKRFQPDIVLLDYKMPGLLGTDICKKIRRTQRTKHVPVVFISGEASIDEKLEAFEMGADDFISKPFDNRELVLRLKRLTSRDLDKQAEISAANLKMNLYSRRIFVNKKEVQLTPKQFDILKLLVSNKNKLVSRQTFLKEIWGEIEVTARNVDSQVNYLKKKIEKFKGQIMAIPNHGYRLEV